MSCWAFLVHDDLILGIREEESGRKREVVSGGVNCEEIHENGWVRRVNAALRKRYSGV